MRKAYTLIELVIVIALIAIMSVVVFIALRSTNVQFLNSAAERVASDIRYAQSLAQNKRDWYGVRFNTTSNYYEVYHYFMATSTEEAVQNPAKLGTDFRVYVGNHYEDVTISEVLCNSSNDYILFNANGVPCDSSGTVYVNRSDIKILHDSGSYKWIYVAAQSGKVSIED